MINHHLTKLLTTIQPLIIHYHHHFTITNHQWSNHQPAAPRGRGLWCFDTNAGGTTRRGAAGGDVEWWISLQKLPTIWIYLRDSQAIRNLQVMVGSLLISVNNGLRVSTVCFPEDFVMSGFLPRRHCFMKFVPGSRKVWAMQKAICQT